jgi:acetyl esterase/lipase
MSDPNNPNGQKGIYVLPFADIDHVRNKRLDIRYAEASQFQTLDLYLPDGVAPDGGWPLVVFIHGGAWMMCDKRDIQLVGPLSLLGHGYAVASINYRLSSEAVFPAQIHDVKAAIRFLKAKSGEFGLDAGRLAVWGASAGAHLASLAGTSAGVSILEDRLQGWSGEDSSVRAVVSFFGPTDFLMMDTYLSETDAGTPNHSNAGSPESKLLGAPITEIPALVRAADPQTWLTPSVPPFFFAHAPLDPIVPVQHSVLFAARITAIAGPGRARLRFVEGAGHAGPEFDEAGLLTEVANFLDANLAGSH